MLNGVDQILSELFRVCLNGLEFGTITLYINELYTLFTALLTTESQAAHSFKKLAMQVCAFVILF